MLKNLRSFTIIPQSLYVERKADRQVAAILEDMGRPGYVLVARQMGKTNLILNARRSLAREGDLFCYLDVSNLIPDLRLFFRNIVDICLEHPTLSRSNAGAEIKKQREKLDLLPHKEHEAELLIIASAISGRLVICLDEIDALIGSNYSDQVFSFIRSVYFSGRANFDAFNRITYLLSGVAEPSDIIKNKDVSPFNIGAKIYLDDFARLELDILLKKANLELDEAVVDFLYERSNGHPRMTWDICSALEDITVAGERPTTSSVEQIINTLYFGDLDMPPVDQIKRVAIESRELRDALMSMHYGRGSTLPDTTRTKLYLAGISRVELSDRNIYFKNEIFEEALSEDFLQNAAPDFFDSAVQRALHLYSAGEFQKSLFELDALRASPLDDEKLWLTQLWTARSYISLGEYESAIETLNSSNATDDASELTRSFFLGISLLRLKDYRKAEPFLQLCADALVDWIPDYEAKLEATVDLASCLIETGTKSSSYIENLCKTVIAKQDHLLNGRSLCKTPASILVEAHVCLATLHILRGAPDVSRAELETAERYASGSTKLKVFLKQLDLTKNTTHRKFILDKAVYLFDEIEKFSVADLESPTVVDTETVYRLLTELDRAELNAPFQRVVNHLIKFSDDESFTEIFSQLNSLANTAGNTRIAIRLLEGMLSDPNNGTSVSVQRALMGLLISIERSSATVYGDRFVNFFDGSAEGSVNSHNIFALLSIYLESAHRTIIKSGESAADLILGPIADEKDISFAAANSIKLIREFVLTRRNLKSNKVSDGASKARVLISKLRKYRSFELPFFPLGAAKMMATEISTQLAESGEKINKREGRKIGRNQIVSVSYQGRIVNGKYKRFIVDLELGRCELIGLAPDNT